MHVCGPGLPFADDTQCKVLVENGDLDGEVPQSDIDTWKAEFDAHGIDVRTRPSWVHHRAAIAIPTKDAAPPEPREE